jgi:hypothetical protein
MRINARTARAVASMEKNIARWKGYTPEQALESVGGNFKPVIQELITKEGIECPEHRAIVNPLNKKVLGVASDGWTPMDNKVVSESISRCADALEVTPEIFRAYSQDGGELVGIDATIGEGHIILGEDRVIPLITCFNGNSGNRPTRFQFALARSICSNGLIVPVQDCDTVISCKHTKMVADRFEFSFDRMITHFKLAENNMVNAFQKMAAAKVTKADVEAYFKKVAKIRGDKEKKADQTVKDLWEVYYNGRNHKEGSDDLVWYAFNAATEYLQHWGFRDDSSMLVANLDGSAAQMKAAAYKAALELAA